MKQYKFLRVSQVEEFGTLKWKDKKITSPAKLRFRTTHPEILEEIFNVVKELYPETEVSKWPGGWTLHYIDVEGIYGEKSDAPLWLVMRWLCDNGWEPMNVYVDRGSGYFEHCHLKKVEEIPDNQNR